MKLVLEEKTVERNFKTQISKFSLDENAKAYKILSDNIYSNKIEAIVREISTNASDAHKDADIADRPFDVSLPDDINPFFIVRDYGKGLSHEDCTTLYTTYFRSTKNEENVSTGCLGLGSKSPFCYSDSFNIESFQDGVRRIYVAAMETEGPTLTLLNEEKTNESSGVKVLVPVKRHDFENFKKTAAKVYSFFDVIPNCHGLKVKKYKAIIDREDWKVIEGDEVNLAIMGQVSYKIDFTNLEDTIKSNSFLSKDQKDTALKVLRAFDNLPYTTPVHLMFNIGELDFQPSREELSYGPQTVKNIALKLITVSKDLETVLIDEVEKQTSKYAARKIISKFPFPVKDKESITYKGEELFYKSNLGHYTTSFYIKNHIDKVYKISKHNISQRMFEDYLSNPKDEKNKPKISFGYHYLIDDDGKLENKRYRLHIRDGYSQLTNNGKTILFFRGTEAELREMLEADDKDDISFQLSSSIVFHRASYRRGAKEIHKTWVYNRDKKSFEKNESYDRKDTETNYVYIIEARGNCIIQDTKFSIKEMNKIIEYIDNGESVFITLKPSEAKNIQHLENFTTIDAYTIDFMNNNQDVKDSYIHETYGLNKYRGMLDRFIEAGRKDLIQESEHLDKLSKNISNTIREMQKSLTRKFLNIFCHAINEKKVDYSEKCAKIEEDYPLLKQIYGSDAKKYLQDMMELAELRKIHRSNKNA